MIIRTRARTPRHADDVCVYACDLAGQGGIVERAGGRMVRVCCAGQLAMRRRVRVVEPGGFTYSNRLYAVRDSHKSAPALR